jgi:hypothetical protein
MKQTALQWFIEQIENHNGVTRAGFQKCIDEGLQMEYKQIKDFFNAGVRYGSGSVMANEWGEDTEEYNFEQYYNETFNNK